MKTSDEINEIATAISKAQGDMGPARKNKVNPYFKSEYADLTSVMNAIREPLCENGLCLVQDAITLPEGISVITRIIHSSGQWIEYGPLKVPLAKNDAQAVGSAISYAKRYAIGAALGVCSEKDDDGNKATKAAHSEIKQQEAVNIITPEQVKHLYDIIENEQIAEKIMQHYEVNDLKELKEPEYHQIVRKISNEAG